MRRIECPLPVYQGQGVFIELPDRWLGKHLIAYQDTGEKISKFEKQLPAILANFARHAVLLENWQLPGLNGNPEKWDLAEADLQIIVWVNQVVSGDFGSVFTLPKA